jgi:hypothetical protein
MKKSTFVFLVYSKKVAIIKKGTIKIVYQCDKKEEEENNE